MTSPTLTVADPRYPAALADGRRHFDAAGYEDRPNAVSPWQPGDREAFARAFAQIATALPEGWSSKATVMAPRPRCLAPVHTALVGDPQALTDTIHRIAGGGL